MICNSCRTALRQRIRPRLPASFSRAVATVPSTPNAAPSEPPPSTIPSRSPPAISSASPASSQPFSTPKSDQSPTNSHVVEPHVPAKPVKLKGSIPGGTELRGLGYLKAKAHVFAKEDDEYPSWLWTLLEQGKIGEKKVDLAAMTKRQRHKYDRRQERMMKNLPKSIPLHEQSQDLTQPGDDAVVSLQRRQELTKSSREARRKKIREANFLKGM